MTKDGPYRTGEAYFGVYDDYSIKNKSGSDKIKIGVVILIYFAETHNDTKPEARLKILENYLEEFSRYAAAYMPLNSPFFKKGDKNEILHYFNNIISDKTSERMSIKITDIDENDKKTLPAYYLDISAGPEEDQLGQVLCYLPGSWLDTAGPKGLIRLVERWASWIEANYGTAGLGFQFREGNCHGTADLLFPYLKRYPGFEIGDGFTWRLENRYGNHSRKIRSTNWLTIIDRNFTEDLGGLSLIEKSPTRNYDLHHYKNGIIVQAGHEPQVGDFNYADIPESYRSVADLLRPIRCEKFQRVGLFETPYPLDEIQETEAWISRFD
ncbi:Protein of unknown function [Methylobacterium sp. ap11]|jgi:hypothetical protein|uniref:type VI immunity family protein n=1 Tax=Methylobacterium sp. ap11 TaxID=1761799 RepID=UPI0008BDF697|nr:type VI immunity family protein [Methylobacterium sp. ap11]SEO73661.1 Protein of unknown function [Methylobacterium sp. ap11]